MRILFTFMCVLALGVMGCSETAGTGGSAGDGGVGGDGGTGGMAGSGGTGGMPECQNPEDCDEGNECTGAACVGGICDYAPVANGTACDETNECTVGTCADGTCDATPVADDTACGDDAGTCQQGSCRVACDEQGIRDAIAAGGGPYTFDCDGPQTVVIEETIVINNDVSLNGDNEGRYLVVDGSRTDLAFQIAEGVTAVLSSLTITKTGNEVGCFVGCGAVVNAGVALTLTNVTVSENGFGDAIVNQDTGTLTLRSTTVSDNQGGAILNNGGELTLTSSTVSRNVKDGIINAAGTATLTNCTVSGNGLSDVEDFGIGNYGVMTLTNCTVSGHDAGPDEGIVNIGALTMTNTIVEGDCEGEIMSSGYNIESPGDTCGFDQQTDQANVSADDLKLGPLQDNGGGTMTHALGAGSVAIDHIPAVDCEVDQDQRGAERPQGPECDVGSVEMEVAP